jgi:GGDEF domain-containing protein
VTANDPGSVPPWISGEFDIADLVRSAPRLLTREQFMDHVERQGAITRKSIDWRFAVFIVNVEALDSIEALRGKAVAEEFLRSAATRVGRRLNPRDAVAVMRDRCFAVLVEVPLLNTTMEEIARSMQRDIMNLVAEQDLVIDATISIGIARLSRSYAQASDVIRDAGVALRHARNTKHGSVVVYNRSMEIAEAIAT